MIKQYCNICIFMLVYHSTGLIVKVMLITTYNLEGIPGPLAEVRRDERTDLWLDEELVLAVSVWESYVALTLNGRLILIRAADYERLIGYPCGIRYEYGRQ